MKRGRKGFVLVFAISVLTLLIVLAVGTAAAVRQKILFISKLEERVRMRTLLFSALSKTQAYVRGQTAANGDVYTAQMKANLHNNPSVFGQVPMGGDHAAAAYTLYDGGAALERFGVVDEERKLNLNTANVISIGRLVERALGLKPEEAMKLARAIADWRQAGESESTGFFSQEYYPNLQFPYPKKNFAYEVPDELLLVKGMTKELYERLLVYATIYGEGQVNINTASWEVLYALGLEDDVIEKILFARRGKDAVEGTPDDLIFSKPFDVASDVNAVVKLDPPQARSIDALNLQGLLTTTSRYFSVAVQGSLKETSWSQNAFAVFCPRLGRLLYWREK